MDRRAPLIVRDLHAPDEADAYVARLSPGERMAMVWDLTVQAWAFTGQDASARFQRDILVVRRRER